MTMGTFSEGKILYLSVFEAMNASIRMLEDLIKPSVLAYTPSFQPCASFVTLFRPLNDVGLRGRVD